MRSTLKIEAPDKVQCSMTITMTLAEWEELRSKITYDHCHDVAWQLKLSISELVEFAKKTFSYMPPAEEPQS
jgi:hypothetical protein